MEPIYIFTLMIMSGFLLGFAALKLYRREMHKREQMEKEQLENEIIEGLIQLKKYTAAETPSVASDKYDLLEVALENNITDITIANEEGLPLISTLKDPDEDSAKYSALFQYARDLIANNLLKINIRCEDNYNYIVPVVKNNIPLYIIIKSNVEIDSIGEKKLIKDILNILDKYLSESTEDEFKEYVGKTHIVGKESINAEEVDKSTFIIK